MPRAVSPWTWRRALRDHGPDQQGFLLTMFMIGTYMDRDGYAFPGQATLAVGARASVRTIRRHVDLAVRLGWLGVELAGRSGQGWRQHAYRCAVPDNIVLDAKDEEITDIVGAQLGDVEPQRADSIVSPPSPKGADKPMSPPSRGTSPEMFHGNGRCGHSEQEGADIPTEGADKLVAKRCGQSLALLTPHLTPALELTPQREAQPDAAHPLPRERVEETIRNLKAAGFSPSEIARSLKPYGLTEDEVRRIGAGA